MERLYSNKTSTYSKFQSVRIYSQRVLRARSNFHRLCFFFPSHTHTLPSVRMPLPNIKIEAASCRACLTRRFTIGDEKIWSGCVLSSEFCSADQCTGARTEPAVLILSEGGFFVWGFAGGLAACRWWNPVVQTQPASVREEWTWSRMKWFELNPRIYFCFLRSLLINIARQQNMREMCWAAKRNHFLLYWEANMLSVWTHIAPGV